MTKTLGDVSKNVSKNSAKMDKYALFHDIFKIVSSPHGCTNSFLVTPNQCYLSSQNHLAFHSKNGRFSRFTKNALKHFSAFCGPIGCFQNVSKTLWPIFSA